MTTTLLGEAPTVHASRYLKQLCKHWSHKFPVDFDAERGTIELATGQAELTALPERLDVRLLAADADALERLRSVVTKHLDRFAFREAPLPFAWRSPDNAP